MDHNYLIKIAQLYNNNSEDEDEKKAKIEKLEIEAVTRYITDSANALGISRNMDDLPIVVAALRAQADFLMSTMDEDRKLYADHLLKQVGNMKVCSIEIDVAELIKQINEQRKEDAQNINEDEKRAEGEQDVIT